MKKIFLVCLAIATVCADDMDDMADGDMEIMEDGGDGDQMEDDMDMADDLPHFEWDGYTLHVYYANGESDSAHMINTIEEETDDEEDTTCTMLGTFEEEDVSVALTGCPGDTTFDIVFNSENTPDSVFEVRDGVVTAVAEEGPGDGPIDDEDATTVFAAEADRITYVDDPEIRKLLERADVDDRSIPKSFEVTLSVRYDKLFLKNVAKGSHAKAKTKVHSVINLARPYFKWKSLGYKISLKILDIAYVDANLQLGSNPGGTLDRAMALSKKNKKDADNYYYFSFDNKGGVGGIAAGIKFGGGKGSGSFCAGKNYRSERTAISEWQTSDAKSSLVFAHELGHALGMPHDFCSDNACKRMAARNFARKDKSGKACWSQNSIMDYSQSIVNKWSKCSGEQVGVWANDIIKIYGKHCKDKSKGSTTSTTAGNGNGNGNGNSKGNGKGNGQGTGNGKGNGKGKGKATACKDKCPGSECRVSPNDICKLPKIFGGCNGMFSELLNEFCKKSCGKC